MKVAAVLAQRPRKRSRRNISLCPLVFHIWQGNRVNAISK